MNTVVEKPNVELTELADGKVLEIQLSGKLSREDYARLAPVVERLVEKHGKIRILVEMRDFHGWTAGALWQDIKFDAKHFNHLERLALVGDAQWQHWMATFCKPFTTAQIRYFDQNAITEARRWTVE